MILAATTSSLEVILAGAITTNQLPFSCEWVDITTSAFTPGHTDGQTNGVTAVTLVAAPAASTQRQVKRINIYNADTVAATVTVRYNNNSTLRSLFVVTLAVGDTLQWNDDIGWSVLTNAGQIKQITGVVSFALKQVTIITSASGTYTVPAGVRALDVECFAGGGGGGGASYSVASNAAVGGGGAAGGYARKLITTPAASYAYARGVAGTAGANSGGTGGTGGDTTFGSSLVTAKGGLGGVGQTYGTALAVVLGGDGASSGGYGDIIEYGVPGGQAKRLSGTVAGSGIGGSSNMGKGGNGRITNGAGNAGSGYASGGGGACSLSSAQAGGVGTAGIIIVTEYY